MQPWSFEPAGRFDETIFESEALRGNPLGDPSARPLWVYLPPGYDDEPERQYPSVYMIQGLTGQLDMWRNRTPFRRNFPELADELFASGGAPALAISCVKITCSITVAPRPPYSFGQATPAHPLSYTRFCHWRRKAKRSSMESRSRRSSQSRGTCAATHARRSSRNTVS